MPLQRVGDVIHLLGQRPMPQYLTLTRGSKHLAQALLGAHAQLQRPPDLITQLGPRLDQRQLLGRLQQRFGLGRHLFG